MDQVTFTFEEIRSALPGAEWIGNFNGAETICAISTDTREQVADSLFIAFKICTVFYVDHFLGCYRRYIYAR